MRYFVPFFASLALLAACTKGQPSTRPNSVRTIVVVDNRGFSDMTIYGLNGGQRIRLGTATGNSKTTLTIPPILVSGSRQVQFLADPIGSRRTSVSDQIYMSPGDTVTLTIPP